MDDASKNPRHSRWAWAGLAMVVLVIGGAVALFFARGGGSGADATAASGSVPASSAAAGSPGSSDGGPSNAAWVALDQVRSAPGEPVLDGGKPLVFFMGAEWCPFCATERWALVEATSRFGKWSGLKELQSRSGQDFFPSLSTYDLSKATYSSDFISVRHAELQNVAGDTLQKLDSFEEGLVNEDDNRGSIPFLLATGPPGRYTVELGFSPGLLDGQSYASLRKEVAAQAPTPAAEAIDGQADAITALICKLDGQQPASVCAKGSIPALEAEIE
jgi:thiol-disulfide isomerase/thioredoxin